MPLASCKILDLGTGTGCLLLAALWEIPNARGVGIDFSAGAIATATRNAAENQLSDRAEFLVMDWYDSELIKTLGRFDMIVSNPPYIASDIIPTLSPEVRNHDPMAALDGGADGLAAYRHLANLTRELLNPGGVMVFEIGYDQGESVAEIFRAAGWHVAPPIKDLGGNDRVLVVRELRALTGYEGAKIVK